MPDTDYERPRCLLTRLWEMLTECRHLRLAVGDTRLFTSASFGRGERVGPTVFTTICPFVCLFLSGITQKVWVDFCESGYGIREGI